MATISRYKFKHSSVRFRRKEIEIKSEYTRARLGGIARTRKLNVKKYFTKKYLTKRYTLYIFRIYKREVTTMNIKEYFKRKEKLELKANHCARALADYMLEEHDPYFKEFDEDLNKKILKKYKAYTKALKALWDMEIKE